MLILLFNTDLIQIPFVKSNSSDFFISFPHVLQWWVLSTTNILKSEPSHSSLLTSLCRRFKNDNLIIHHKVFYYLWIIPQLLVWKWHTVNQRPHFNVKCKYAHLVMLQRNNKFHQFYVPDTAALQSVAESVLSRLFITLITAWKLLSFEVKSPFWLRDLSVSDYVPPESTSSGAGTLMCTPNVHMLIPSVVPQWEQCILVFSIFANACWIFSAAYETQQGCPNPLVNKAFT